MKVLEISSSKNEYYKNISKLKQKKYRHRASQFLIEGIKFVKHALEKGEEMSQLVYCSDLINESILESILRTIPDRVQVISMSKNIFEDLSDTVNSQGVIAVVQMRKQVLTLDPKGLYLALDQIQDPGNLGTMIRTADAAGFSGVIYNKGTVDPYSEKVLRSTMGSIFSIPLTTCEDLSEFLRDAKKQGVQVLCTSLEISVDYSQVDYKQGSIIVIGNESQGISTEVFNESTQRIKIPIYGEAESLNAAIAAAIIMYEATKQRR